MVPATGDYMAILQQLNLSGIDRQRMSVRIQLLPFERE